MQGTYDLWLVAGSYLVAVVASYAALALGAAVTGSPRRTAWIWLACGSIAMGLGIWSMHFIGMLVFHLPIPLAYDVPLTLLSVAPAILSSALALVLVRRGDLKGWRLNDGIWDWDLTTNHVFMSPRLLGILGCEAGEVDSVEAWMQHVHADDRDALKATFVCHLRRETETFSAISRARFRPATWSAS